MKKSLIALAVAATAVASTPMTASAAMLQAANPDQSGINIYGSLRPQYVYEDGSSFGDGASRWGIQGQHDLGNGNAAFYRFERALNTSNATQPEQGRLSYAGLKGGWGAAALGQQWTPYYNVVAGPSDIFASAGINNYTGPFRTPNAISYALPTGMPIGGAVAFVVDGDEEGDDEDVLDHTSLGLTATTGPVNWGLGWTDTDDDSLDRWGLSVDGNFGGFGVFFMIEDVDLTDNTPWALTGTFAGFALQYQDADLDAAPDGDETWTLGYTYRVGRMSRLQLALEESDLAADTKFVARWRVDF